MKRGTMIAILWAAPAIALFATACGPMIGGGSCSDLPITVLESGEYVSESLSTEGDEASPHAVAEKMLALDLADDRVTISYTDEDGRAVFETWRVVEIVEGYY